jgi:hypothetical protein
MGLGPSVVEVLVQIVAAIGTASAGVIAVLNKIEANTRDKKDK